MFISHNTQPLERDKVPLFRGSTLFTSYYVCCIELRPPRMSLIIIVQIHPSNLKNQDMLTGPKGGQSRGSSVSQFTIPHGDELYQLLFRESWWARESANEVTEPLSNKCVQSHTQQVQSLEQDDKQRPSAEKHTPDTLLACAARTQGWVLPREKSQKQKKSRSSEASK